MRCKKGVVRILEGLFPGAWVKCEKGVYSVTVAPGYFNDDLWKYVKNAIKKALPGYKVVVTQNRERVYLYPPRK